MKSFFLIAFILLSEFLHSQTFEKTYRYKQIAKPQCMVEYNNGYIISIMEQNNDYDSITARLICINKQGEIVTEKTVNKYYIQTLRNVTIINDTLFLASGYYYQESYSQAVCIYIYFNEKLTLLKDHHLKTPALFSDDITINTIKLQNNNIVSTVSIQSNPNDYILFHTLTYDAIITDTTIIKNNLFNYTSSLIHTYSNNGFYNFIADNVFEYNNLFNQVDSFKILNVTDDYNDIFQFYYYAKWNYDKLIIGGQNRLNDKTNMSVARFDTAFNFINQHQLVSENYCDYPSLYNGMDMTNKYIFLSGTADFRFGPTFSNYANGIRIASFDIELNKRWDYTYGDSAYHFAYFTLATNDGGCLIAGHKYNFTQSEEFLDLYLLKVDSLGNYQPNNIYETVATQKVSVYPNPGHNYVTIALENLQANSIFQLYSYTGKVLLQQTITTNKATINTNLLNTGLYFYKITAENTVLKNGKWVKQ